MGGFGGQVTQLAIPLVAVLTLHASAAEMGVLTAVGRAPYLVFGLLVGVWVDRWRRRPVMVWAAAAEAALLASIPVASIAAALTVVQLYVVGFLAGTANLAFEVAGMAFLPAIVARDRLVEGNTRIQASDSAAATVGPPLAGALIQAVTAPVAILADTAATVLKMALLATIPADPAPARAGRQHWWRELREGLDVVVRNPLLRAIAGCTATSNLFVTAYSAIYVLFLVRDLRLAPAQIGLVFAAGGPASLLAVAVAGRLARRVGVGWAITAGAVSFSCAGLLVPWVPAAAPMTVPLLMLAAALGPGGGTLYNVNQVSLRQAITPDRLQGRMGATMRFLVWGVMPVGALAGGALGQAIGLRPALWVCAGGAPLALLWLLAGRVPRVREVPAAAARS